MALEFTNIPDRTGAAIYLFSDGTVTSEKELTRFGEEVDARTEDSTQVVLLDYRSGDGLRVKEFYSLMTFPCVLIVMDDDTVSGSWERTLPTVDEVAYRLSQINGSMR